MSVRDLQEHLAGVTLTPADAETLILEVRSRTIDPANALIDNIRKLVTNHVGRNGKLPDTAFTAISSIVMSNLADGGPDRHRAVMVTFRATAGLTDPRPVTPEDDSVRYNQRGDYGLEGLRMGEPGPHGETFEPMSGFAEAASVPVDTLSKGLNVVKQRLKPYAPAPSENPSYTPAPRKIRDNPQA